MYVNSFLRVAKIKGCHSRYALRAAQVGGRSVVNKDITQYVEIRPEEERFLRLLEVLGEW